MREMSRDDVLPATILIVDDDRVSLRLLTSVLAQREYTVRAVSSASLALASIETEVPDLILLDIIMPEVDGYELCTRLKADESTRDIPVIFISAATEVLNKMKAFAVGGVDYITKPFQQEEVLARVKTHLGLRAMQKRLEQKNAQLEQEIVERERAEEALKNSREQLELITDTMPSLLAYVNAKQQYLYVNQAYADWYGLSKQDIRGSDLKDILSPESYQGAIKYIEGALQGQASSFENIAYDTEGQLRAVKAMYVPHFDQDGRVKAFLAVVEDITEQKRAAEALRASEIQYRTTIDAMMDMLTVVGADLKLVLCNAAAERWLKEYPSKESAIGHDLLEVFPFLAETVRDEYRHVFDTGEPLITQESSAVADKIIFTETHKIPIIKGDEVIQVVAIIRDISERRRAERALKEYSERLEEMVAERTAELQAQYAQLDAILRSVGDAILVSDPDLRIRYVNPAFTTLTGYTADEIVGKYAGSVGAGAESDIARQVESALAQGKVWQGEAISRRKDGRTYDAALVVAPVRDADGRLVGYVSSHRDISPLKNLERARNQFITNVSHQLRTPVTTISLYAHLLREGIDPERADYFLQMIEQQTDQLTHLIQDTLEMAALDSGRVVNAWKIVSLPSLVENVVTRYRSRAEASDLTLTARPAPPRLSAIKGDLDRLAQALGEIVENALAFTQPGGQVTLEIKSVEDKGLTWITISVQDTGPGITPEEQRRVFDRFFRGELADAGHIPGSGLGLSIAHEIVHAHGGRITVESQVGEGSTFTIWLPSSKEP